MISPNKPAPTCLRTHLYTHTVKVYARACDHIFFIFTFKEQKRVSLSPARVASSVTETYPFLPCVRLVLAPVSSLGLATNKCSKNCERDSTGDHGQHSSRRSVSLVAPRTSAAPDCGAVHGPHGLCSPIASEGGESEQNGTSELMAPDLVRLHICCFAVWMLFFH